MYATFVMQTVVDEDQSRVAWPSCPSSGWVAGVDRLSAHPNGSPLGLLPNARPPVPPALDAPASCSFIEGSDIDGDGIDPWSTRGNSAADCCDQCNKAPGCAGVVYEAAGTSNCWFKAAGAPSPRANRTACLNNNHRKTNTIEVHGPYQHGSGWPAVNGGGTSDLNPFPPGYPLAVDPTVAMGPQFVNQFASEFGGSVWSSFESMAPTLAPAHWGIHGGGPPDVCGRGFEADCNGTNVAAQRNYPTDNYMSVYFGDGVDRTAVGEFAFKAQLFQAMVGQALNVAMKITTKRLTNCFGTMIWQLGEVWPTGACVKCICSFVPLSGAPPPLIARPPPPNRWLGFPGVRHRGLHARTSAGRAVEAAALLVPKGPLYPRFRHLRRGRQVHGKERRRGGAHGRGAHGEQGGARHGHRHRRAL